MENLNNDITTRVFWDLDLPKKRTIADIVEDLRIRKISINDARRELGFEPLPPITSALKANKEEKQINQMQIMMDAQVLYVPKMHLFPTKRESKSYLYKENRP